MHVYVFFVSCLAVGLVSLGCIFAVALAKGIRSRLVVSWILMLLSFVLWSVGLGFMSCSGSEEEAAFWLRYVHYAGAIFIPSTFLHFILMFLGQARRKKGVVIGSYAVSLLLQYLNMTGMLAHVAATPPFRFYTVRGQFYDMFTIAHYVMGVYAFHLLWKQCRQATGIRRNQARYLLLGMVILWISGSTAFFPVYHIPIFPFGLYVSPLYVLVISYAIIRHRLMGIDLFLKKALAFSIYVAVCAIPCWACFYIGMKCWDGMLGLKSLCFAMIALCVMVLVQRFKLKGEITLSKILFQTSIDYSRTLNELSLALISHMDLQGLLGEVAGKLGSLYDLEDVSFCISSGKEFRCFQGVPAREPVVIGAMEDAAFFDVLKAGKNVVIADEMSEDSRMRLCMDKMMAEVLIKIQAHGELLGICILGKKRAEYVYTNEDVGFLQQMSAQLAIAVQNAKAYEEIADLNVGLEEKVRIRTKELEETREHLVHMEKMASLGTLVNGVAHEIRNPLAQLKGSYQAIEEEFNRVQPGKGTDVLLERTRPCLGVIERGIERIKVIVDEMNLFSRKDIGCVEKININGLLDEVLRRMESRVSEGITVTKTYGADCVVQGSYSRILQVFRNVIQNAVGAVGQAGHIQINTCSDGNEVRVSVKDNGCGIESSAIKKVFDPFYTTKDIATGLGLSISYDIVKQHRGDIRITSKGSDQGTDVLVCLPKKFTLSDAASPLT